ncbi:MAG: YdcF family protein, partial [Prochlorococcus sp.]
MKVGSDEKVGFQVQVGFELMFLLSKLLPLLVLPLGVALLLLIWGGWQRSRWPGLAALAVLWIFSTPLTGEALWRWLERPYQRQSAEVALKHADPAAVVVLGTGRHAAPGPIRASEWTDADRFFGGIEAYQQLRRQGQSPRLIFTGGWSPNKPELLPEGDVLHKHALSLGIPPADVFSTARVSNTAAEARAIAALLPRGSALVLVTSAFHLPRAISWFERQGLRVIPFPVDFQASGVWAGQPLANPMNYVPSASGLSSSSY